MPQPAATCTSALEWSGHSCPTSLAEVYHSSLFGRVEEQFSPTHRALNTRSQRGLLEEIRNTCRGTRPKEDLRAAISCNSDIWDRSLQVPEPFPEGPNCTLSWCCRVYCGCVVDGVTDLVRHETEIARGHFKVGAIWLCDRGIRKFLQAQLANGKALSISPLDHSVCNVAAVTAVSARKTTLPLACRLVLSVSKVRHSFYISAASSARTEAKPL